MDVQVREVTHSDRDDMMEISRHTWGGHDYMPHVFDDWLSDPDSHVVGIEVDGHIVALTNLRLVDAGRTGWMEGLRVHPRYRKKGLARILTKHLVEMGSTLGVTRLRYTTGTDNTASLRLAEEFGMHRVFDMGVFWREAISRIKYEKRATLAIIAPQHLYSMLQTSQDLVPTGTVIYDWKALDATLANLEKIAAFCEIWAEVKDGMLVSFSFGMKRKELAATEWCFTIYAHDSRGFTSHLSHHLKRAKEGKYRTISGIYSPEFQRTVSRLSWIPKTEKGFTLTLVEKDILPMTE